MSVLPRTRSALLAGGAVAVLTVGLVTSAGVSAANAAPASSSSRPTTSVTDDRGGHGADDAKGHVRHGHGTDDAKGHVRHGSKHRSADD